MNGKLRRSGFTLLEVLLVMAILSLLAAIIFVVMGPAKRMARRTTCTSNLRQIGLAYEMYVMDYGRYPFPHALVTSPYLSDRRLLFCPDDTALAPQGTATSYHVRFLLPPRFLPAWSTVDAHPGTVLVYCDQHLGQRTVVLKDDATALTPPQYPYHLVLHASGGVERVHLNHVRTFFLPGRRLVFMNAYPGEPGYEEAQR